MRLSLILCSFSSIHYAQIINKVLSYLDFTEEELNSLREAGAVAVGLGPHRLRVETATMALLSTVMLWSDCQELSSN